MIVQPDFLRHWKTRKLVTMTGDAGSPLALIRLWSHCQTARKWEFPELKRDDLAAICEWDLLKLSKLSCEKALTACKWIEKLPGGGYRVRNWDEHNKNLIVNWNRNPSGKPKHDSDSDPTDTPRAPHHAPDKTRPDQTKPDSIEQTKPDQTRPDASPFAALRVNSSGARMDALENESGVGGNGLVDGLLLGKRIIPFSTPTKEQVHNCLLMHFAGAERFAEAFINSMEKQNWRAKDNSPISSWQSMAKAYASKCALNQKQGGKRSR